jgi:hypothetical protein
MSSCQGELSKREFHVKATDKDGTVLVSENIATLRNGFFELWLPRDRRVQLTIQGMGRKVSGRIETFERSKTCVTTFRLR